MWYAAVFALFLGGFAVATYLFIAQSSAARIDEYLAETAGAVAGALEFERTEKRSEAVAVADVVQEFSFRDIEVAVLDRSTGELLASDLGPPPPDVQSDAAADAAEDTAAGPQPRSPHSGRTAPDVPGLGALLARAPRGGPARFTTVDAGGVSPVRVMALPYRLGGRDVVIGTAQSLRAQTRLLREAKVALWLGVPLMLLLATAGGYGLARKSLQPVVAMSERAERIGASTLHERLPVANAGDELGRLATVFNGLLARLDSAFDQQRQFIADASHELRTPVSIVRSEAELALSKGDRPAGEARAALAVIHGEARRLTRIVEDLFLIARADAGEQPLEPVELYLNELAGDCVRAMRSLAQAKRVALADATEGAGEDFPFRGDEALLRRMVMNLLDNAIKYTPAGGRVSLDARRGGAGYTIAVRDTGPGVPAEARDRIFDRFYRARRDRGAGLADAGGAGLGLAIARWVAETHGGRVDLTSTGPEGSVFTATLPGG